MVDNGGMSQSIPIPGYTHVYSGKVRDLYVPDDEGDADTAEHLLVVASDRISAFDHVLSPGIPGKGELLTELSRWWFAELSGIPNHLAGEPPAEVANRAMLVKRLDMYPIECVVRGYITGSGWTEYQRTGGICGIALPPGLHNGDRLPEPVYTPAWKAPQGEHDENITFERTVELVGAETAIALVTLSLEVYRRAALICEERGLILADTKFEFGADRNGVITLADEVLTSDSSRYWDAERWEDLSLPASERLESFDKQIVRNWLLENWDLTGTPPELPAAIVKRTAARYRELIERLTARV
jgi:phosphoribosylaminoimidazole-succinocarboxamide synthase